MSKFAAFIGIVLSLFAAFVGIVPGALALAGVLIATFGLIVSLFSIRKFGKRYYYISLFIATFGVLCVNDVTRLWNSITIPFGIKASIYAGILFLFSSLTLVAFKLDAQNRKHNSGVKE